jgi:tetratricopeptide (TPR) repeat protein
MKSKSLIQLTLIGLLFVFSIFTTSGQQAAKAKHPAYLHALSDLRAARWLIEHQTGDFKRSEDEVAAVKKIDDAINEIKKASIDDGKNLNDHPIDEVKDHVGRLHKAVEYLNKALNDINKEEDNNTPADLRQKANNHINEAIRLTEKAIKA